MKTKLILNTKRLILRPFDIKDYSDFQEYITDNKVNKYLGISTPINPEVIKLLFNSNINNPLCWAMELKSSGKVIGDFHLDNIVENYLAHIGFAINSLYHKQGYGSEAAAEIVKFGITKLNLGKIRAISLIQNIASIKLLEKLYFEKEALIYDYDFGGTLGDVFYFSINHDKYNINNL
ncbi:MAG: GNAT family N-acetyltransferase [Clostridiales bacterium]|nr:GNAT family N-acetyltransferase [Clostridiales bacterium]